MSIYGDLISRKLKIAIVGLGYVGLPLALEFSRKLSVIGFDIDTSRINQLRAGVDPNKEVGPAALAESEITYTDDPSLLADAAFIIITVPTPVDRFNVPDLSFLKEASRQVGRFIKKGSYVVYESTMYPGCTEEECIPVIAETSGLKPGIDFKFGYSPERINPGDTENTVRKVVKVVAGCDELALDEIAKIYGIVVDAGVFLAPSIKVAEAAKIVENTQRDINIALMNELSMIFDRMEINTYDVLDAASSKWNFLHFSPGLVGGHCIGVDPYYLAHKAEALGYETKLISASRFINDQIARNVARKVITHVLRYANDPAGPCVLVMGATFKENVSDIRNSKIMDAVREIQDFQIQVDIVDPNADPEEVLKEYGLQLKRTVDRLYDAVIITVPHFSYLSLTEDYFCSITHSGALIADLKGLYRGLTRRAYWSL